MGEANNCFANYQASSIDGWSLATKEMMAASGGLQDGRMLIIGII